MKGHDWKLIRDVTISTQACSDTVLREGTVLTTTFGDVTMTTVTSTTMTFYASDCLSLLQGQHSAKHSTAVEDLPSHPVHPSPTVTTASRY